MTTDPEAVSQIYTVIWLAVATASWAGIIALAVKWKRAQPISSSGVVAALQHARKLIVNNPEHQARAVAFRTHQSFVGQHTQLINALRGHLAEFGLERAALNLTQVAHSNCLLSHRFFCGKPVPTFLHDALIIAQGSTNLKAVVGMIDDDTIDLPDAVRDIVRLYLNQIALLTQKIEELHFKLRAATKVDDAMRYRADLAS